MENIQEKIVAHAVVVCSFLDTYGEFTVLVHTDALIMEKRELTPKLTPFL